MASPPPPSDNTTLTDILDQFADAGFAGEFETVDASAEIQCLSCQHATPAAGVARHAVRRLEGASDPADMAAVVAITCPNCGIGGALVLPFGPNASAAEAKILADLRDDGDLTQTAGRDVMPGEQAPSFAAASSTGRELGLDDFVGKVPVALTFTGSMSASSTDALLEAFAERFPEFGRQQVQALVVTPAAEQTVRRQRLLGVQVPLLADPDGDLMASYASSATFPSTVMIDRSGTVTRLVEGGEAADHVEAVLTAVGGFAEQADE